MAARGGLLVTEAPRSADPAARRRAMEIGTEISRKIRVRPASAGAGHGGQAVARSNGAGGPGLPRLRAPAASDGAQARRSALGTPAGP